MSHSDYAPLFGREESRTHRDVFYVAAGHSYLPRQRRQIDVIAQRTLRWKQHCPYQLSILFVRKWKIDDDLKPAHKRFVDVLTKVSRENRNPVVLFHLLQQVTDLDIRVAIVSFFHF